MSLPERIPSSTYQADVPELSPQLQTEVDLGLIDYATAAMKEAGVRPARPSSVGIPYQRTAKSASRRGGRSYPEPSDSELDPYWNVSAADYAGPQPERGNGYREAQVAKQEIADDVLRKEAGGDVSRLLALQRSHYDRQQTRR